MDSILYDLKFILIAYCPCLMTTKSLLIMKEADGPWVKSACLWNDLYLYCLSLRMFSMSCYRMRLSMSASTCSSATFWFALFSSSWCFFEYSASSFYFSSIIFCCIYSLSFCLSSSACFSRSCRNAASSAAFFSRRSRSSASFLFCSCYLSSSSCA